MTLHRQGLGAVGSPSESDGLAESDLTPLLRAAARWHRHLCPRIVLGVRMGLAGLRELGLSPQRKAKRLLVIAETDGCFVSGLEAATGTAVRHRTLRIEDYGKVAATFADAEGLEAIRITPHPDSRARACRAVPQEPRRWFAMRDAYQWMPERDLIVLARVRLTPSPQRILSRPHVRAMCEMCGEEVLNERGVRQGGQVLCRACAGGAYYRRM